MGRCSGFSHGDNQAQEEFLRLAASPQWAALTGEQRAQLAVLSEKLILQQQEAVAMQQLARVQEEARASYAARACRPARRAPTRRPDVCWRCSRRPRR